MFNLLFLCIIFLFDMNHTNRRWLVQRLFESGFGMSDKYQIILQTKKKVFL